MCTLNVKLGLSKKNELFKTHPPNPLPALGKGEKFRGLGSFGRILRSKLPISSSSRPIEGAGCEARPPLRAHQGCSAGVGVDF